jgi:GT2 family glycosyltransferase
VVVVNYRRWDDTARLVGQLQHSRAMRDGQAEVLIIDNNSPTHPAMRNLRKTQGVTLRRWRSNKGFATAVNQGCRLARGEWLLLLNPDMSAAPGFLDHVIEQAELLDPRVGIVGFRLLNDDGTRQLSTGSFPKFFSTLARLLLPRHRRKYNLPRGDEIENVDWVTGCCLLIRRECFEELGGLDPAYFLYYEDVDLCKRAVQRGWGVQFDPAISITHHRPLHSRVVAPHIRLVTRHALLTYALKHWPAWQFPLLAACMRAETTVKRMAAWWSGDADAFHTFSELGSLIGDLLFGRNKQARERLLRIIRQEEQQRDAAPLHPDRVSQSPRSASPLPEQRQRA